MDREDLMKKINANDPETHSADIVAENVEHLKALFPEAFTEGKVDFEVLKQLLGGEVDEREEKYGLNWHGKRRARQLALTPSIGTLRPCPEESVDWDTTQNLMIEGDNLEVLKLLQKSYAGKVKLIYIDPPYNTGKDFVYPDDYRDNIQNYLELTGQVDGENQKLSSNTEASGRFHTDWLSMMYPRLKLARNLLRNDGAIFVSIDDAEVANLRIVCEDIFGDDNFISNFVRRRRMATGMRDTLVSPDHEYVLAYAKNIEALKLYGFARQRSDFPLADEKSAYRSTDLSVGMTREMRPNQHYAIRHPILRTEYWPPDERVWRFESKTMERHIVAGNIIWPDDNPSGRMTRPRFKTRYIEGEDKANPISTWISTTKREDRREVKKEGTLTAGLNQDGTKEVRELFGVQLLEYPKPLSLLKGIVNISTRSDDVILDFFAGSGTTGQATWECSVSDGAVRRFIMVQLPELSGRHDYETIAEITKERLRRAGSKIRDENPIFSGDLGFRVFKLDTSNIRTWEPDHDDLEGTLLDSIDHIKPDRTEEDIFYELLLKLGLDLCVPIETRNIAGKSIRSIGAGTLIACLDEKIAQEDVEPVALGIAEWHKELSPAGVSTVVFRDSAFVDDIAKTNLAAILEQHGLGNVRSL